MCSLGGDLAALVLLFVLLGAVVGGAVGARRSAPIVLNRSLGGSGGRVVRMRGEGGGESGDWK